jgi:hypothetical protein
MSTSRERLVVVGGDRLVGEVARRHDEWAVDLGEQQVVEWCVGEHGADVGQVACDGSGEHRRRVAGAGAPPQEHDGAYRACEERLLGFAHLGEPACGGHVAHHHRERLAPAVLALPQPGDSVLVGRVARKVETAEALERDDPSSCQRSAGRADDRVGALAFGGDVAVRGRALDGVRATRPAPLDGYVRGLQVETGAAREACVGLGVEAPVGRVGVLGGTLRAHIEGAHRRPGRS